MDAVNNLFSKIDFKGDKIIAFVHIKSSKLAKKLIKYWNGRKMGASKIGLQVQDGFRRCDMKLVMKN